MRENTAKYVYIALFVKKYSLYDPISGYRDLVNYIFLALQLKSSLSRLYSD